MADDPGRRAQIAAEALARAKADARARGNRPAGISRPAEPAQPGAQVQPGAADARSAAGSGVPGVPAPRRRLRREDPEPLRAAIDGLLDDHGWRTAAAIGSVFGRWAQIVGPELAAHTTPEYVTDGELTVTADSTAWATQLRLLAHHLVRRINVELGNGSVRRVRVRGPAAGPAGRPGEWRVRGGRGPRDTYG